MEIKDVKQYCSEKYARRDISEEKRILLHQMADLSFSKYDSLKQHPQFIDYLEQKGKIKENVRDNLFSPLVLGLLCKKHNIHFTYLGTGCIFKYDENHPFGDETNGFTEESLPNFFDSSYSTVKGYTDELMHLLEDNCLNLRIRMPLIDKLEPRNFITKIINVINCS